MSDQVNQHFNQSDSQTETHQQSSFSQHLDMLHGDSSEVTDQTSSQWTTYPLQGQPYHHGNQQQLQNGAPSPINPQSNAVPHQHIPPSDRTLPSPQTLTCPSDASIQQPQGNSSLSANSQFTSNLHQTAPLFNSVIPGPPPLIRMGLPSLDSSQSCVTVSHLVSRAGIPHDQYSTDQEYLYPLPHTQEIIYSRGLANTFNLASPAREVSSQPASPFSGTGGQSSIQQPYSSSCSSADYSSQLTQHPHFSQPLLTHNPHQIHLYGPTPHQISQQPTLHSHLRPQPRDLPPRFSHLPPNHLHVGQNTHSQLLPSLNLTCPHHNHNQYDSLQHVETGAQQIVPLMLIGCSTNSLSIVPHSTLAIQRAPLPDYTTSSVGGRLSTSSDVPDPKRPCSSPHNTHSMLEVQHTQLCTVTRCSAVVGPSTPHWQKIPTPASSYIASSHLKQSES